MFNLSITLETKPSFSILLLLDEPLHLSIVGIYLVLLRLPGGFVCALFSSDLFLFSYKLGPSIASCAFATTSSAIELRTGRVLGRLSDCSYIWHKWMQSRTYELSLCSLMGFLGSSQVRLVFVLIWFLWSLRARVG